MRAAVSARLSPCPSRYPPSRGGTRYVRAAMVEEVRVRVLGVDLDVAVWSPGDGPLPLLLAHDGPAYEERAALTRYAAAVIERGAVAPFRVALVPAGDRDQWYSASAAYSRALYERILPAVRDAFGLTGAPVGIGASLGALALL